VTRAPRLGLAIALVVLAIDQASKYWMIHVFDLGTRGPIALLPILDLVLAWNKGISYSLFRSDGLVGRLVLVGVAVAALAVLSVWLLRTQRMVTAVGLGLVAGGAAGNALDRLLHGAVADFLYFHTPVSLGPLSNYVFNLADVGIVLGVSVLLYENLVSQPAGTAPQPHG
jgi:signal peptidase II